MSVVAGYLPTAGGSAAVDAAIEEARRRQTSLVVVNTGDREDYSGPEFATAKDLDALDAELQQAGLEHVVIQPTRGLSAAEEILQAADDHGAEVVVIGIRRRSPIGKLILGSTAQEVLLAANCPVLAVKPD
ncbi:MAG: universal stress protein [Ornithinimicrobium sp.]